MENYTAFIARHMGLFYAFATILITLLIIETIRAKRGRVRLRPSDAVLLINKQNAVVIDIRSNDTYRKGHIIDALNLPPRELAEAGKKLDKFKNKPLIVVDGNGTDAQKAAAELVKQGYNAFILAGGIRAWSGADLPLVKE